MNLEHLNRLVTEGESDRLEFKKSTGELKGGMETLCAFLKIRSLLSPSPSTTVLRDELNLLRSLELIEGSGHGAGARWWLKPTGPSNRTE